MDGVDAVIAAVEELDERPVEEHVGRLRDGPRAAAPRPGRPSATPPTPPGRPASVRACRVVCGSTPSWSAGAGPVARARQRADRRRAGSRSPGAPATKPATGVTTDVAIVVADDPDRPGLRLPRRAQAGRRAGGVRARRARGRRAAAASTRAPRPAASPTCCCGAGAREVVAVDVGYGQLAWRLQQDERVAVHDRTNVRELTPELVGGPVDLVVGDLSFISLGSCSTRCRGDRRRRRPGADGEAAVRGRQGAGRQGRRGPRPGAAGRGGRRGGRGRGRAAAGAPGR